MAPNEESGHESKVQNADAAGMIGAIAHWCESLHGAGTLNDALGEVATCIGAEAAALSRGSRHMGGETHTVSIDSTHRTPRLERSFARSILGAYFSNPKPASIWLKSMVDEEFDPALMEFHRRRKFRELAVIPLSVQEKSVDVVEFHFPDTLRHNAHALLNMMSDTLVQSWSRRSPGLFTQMLTKNRDARKKVELATPILSMENPARLSRAEFRVCLLLSHGENIERVRKSLDISGSTLRTHLRNIFAKTNTANQSELLFHLLSAMPVEKPDGAARDVA